ncbi:MAG: hypothetical protein Q8R00_00490 [Candidatus Nanoarchaeia archaeon]|nr:hypothetical protein [Candidatus Nanoarchaeia archaeon]
MVKQEENQQAPQLPQELPPEVKKKLEKLQGKLDKFKKEILTKFKEYVLGIALLPPERQPSEAEKKNIPKEVLKEIEERSKNINALVLVDDSDVKKMTPFELKDKLFKIMEKTASDIDKLLKPQVMLMSELREACFDAKYEVLGLISIGAPIYDPKDLLAAIKVAEVHKSMVLKRFDKYIVSYIAVGSLFRGDATSHDIDVALVVDDTDVKRMSRYELKDKLGAIIRSMGYEAAAMTGVKKQFHIQVYILTDFWESIKEASPVIFTFLRDGTPLYDRGVFMPWKLLLQMGRIRPSPEAIDMHMDLGEKLLERVNSKLLSIVLDDVYYSALNPSQSALMLYGLPPATPKETINLMEEIFVKKEKLLEPRYIEILKNIRKAYKEIEHGKIKTVTGKEVDSFLKDARDYLDRIKKLFEQISKKADIKRTDDFYDTASKIMQDLLEAEGIKEKDIEEGFKNLVNKGKLPKQFLESIKNILKVKDKKLAKEEVEKIRKESQGFLRAMIEHIQRKRGAELERAKIRVKYGDKFGEVFLLDNTAYIVNDIDAPKKEIIKAEIMPNGGLGKKNDSNLKDLEEAISKVSIPKNVFIKEKIFEDLRKLFGKDVEIMVNY